MSTTDRNTYLWAWDDPRCPFGAKWLKGEALKETRLWLASPVRGLGSQIPLELARTEAGAQEVENVPGAIEDGGYS